MLMVDGEEMTFSNFVKFDTYKENIEFVFDAQKYFASHESVQI
jgi:hypothetical protein